MPHPAMQACCGDGAWQGMPATDAAWCYSQTGRGVCCSTRSTTLITESDAYCLLPPQRSAAPDASSGGSA